MTVGYQIENIITEWGSQDFVHALFSNIAYHLEDGAWGSKCPHLMNELYQGKLQASSVGKALEELREVQSRFAHVSPSLVIWDLDDLSKKPPWGAKIADTITDLSNYFVTSTGRDLLPDLVEGLEYALEEKLPVEIVAF